ncbi:DUF2599 domain-containing protein [Mycobacterium montefiorense]|uniref:DUF2599 domain-containing protein n=1 Tax=Mycobacterium montefiorense TaxID=154654 RepID=A0AA37UZS4_9MYCO|nr:DUF2599 domain-containing protein [Mycobacterium montefiorense]GBG40557.1 hypothetical protein MmonteBS_49290 [Mycobacterium montefiorense]GKU37996.1 hypothetical protein NJB14191_53420 [Mycobacterium montefiorense]GKU39274.1 hypothetical protein NJB14192_12690 [Mycobacterium montefiorense]GKU44737.1 hypothetical protein NJB14194_13630 [Mycobacterium montefiorense]GKU53800.1 hypothetical protein NJB14195_50410 [Mycobacterium montefiorense]
MKALLAAPAAAVLALLGLLPETASADPGTETPNPVYSPPFVDHTAWAQWARLTSLRVFPTPSGRLASRQPGTTDAADEAWSEVLAMAPDADTPGIRAQFICHWQFAETAQPGKTSWNLEPWRPVVDDTEMFASGCNPGGPEESFS